jgi:hypothetical protein
MGFGTSFVENAGGNKKSVRYVIRVDCLLKRLPWHPGQLCTEGDINHIAVAIRITTRAIQIAVIVLLALAYSRGLGTVWESHGDSLIAVIPSMVQPIEAFLYFGPGQLLVIAFLNLPFC